MKTIAVTLGSIATAFAATALAQDNQTRNYPYDVERVERLDALERGVPYTRYDDPYTNELREQRRYYRDYRDYRGYRGDPGIECWNWRARTFERAREGEFQDDLDYSRCRAYSDGAYRTYRWRY